MKEYIRMSFEEFEEIVDMMKEVPRRDKETQRDYFERLKTKHKVNRSRFTLQIVEKSIVEEPEDMKKAYEKYRTLMKGKKGKKEENEETGQIEMEMPVDYVTAAQIEREITTEKPEMSDQVKMMRFVANQVDKVIMKLDQIYNLESQILRAVRRE